MQKLSLVIFDCDGVLVDSEYLSATTLIEVFSEIGIKLDLAFVYTNFVGHSFTTVAAKYARQHGINVPDSFEQDYRTRLLQGFVGKLHAMPAIEFVLDNLAVPFCVASGSSPTRVNKSLEITGLLPRFTDHIFTTSMVEHGKPAPDIFFHVAKSLGIDPHECLVIEDSTTGTTAGKAAGMVTWHFTGGAHFNYGYEKVHNPNLVDRRFDRMLDFFEDAQHLLRQVKA